MQEQQFGGVELTSALGGHRLQPLDLWKPAPGYSGFDLQDRQRLGEDTVGVVEAPLLQEHRSFHVFALNDVSERRFRTSDQNDRGRQRLRRAGARHETGPLGGVTRGPEQVGAEIPCKFDPHLRRLPCEIEGAPEASLVGIVDGPVAHQTGLVGGVERERHHRLGPRKQRVRLGEALLIAQLQRQVHQHEGKAAVVGRQDLLLKLQRLSISFFRLGEQPAVVVVLRQTQQVPISADISGAVEVGVDPGFEAGDLRRQISIRFLRALSTTGQDGDGAFDHGRRGRYHLAEVGMLLETGHQRLVGPSAAAHGAVEGEGGDVPKNDGGGGRFTDRESIQALAPNSAGRQLIQRRGIAGEDDARARFFPPATKQLEHTFDLGNFRIRRCARHPTRLAKEVFSRRKRHDGARGLLAIGGRLAPGEEGKDKQYPDQSRRRTPYCVPESPHSS